MPRKTGDHPRTIDPERWQRVKDILADALEQPTPAARIALVQTRCANDAALLAEAVSLVNEAETQSGSRSKSSSAARTQKRSCGVSPRSGISSRASIIRTSRDCSMPARRTTASRTS